MPTTLTRASAIARLALELGREILRGEAHMLGELANGDLVVMVVMDVADGAHDVLVRDVGKRQRAHENAV